MVEFYNIKGQKITQYIKQNGVGMDLPKELAKIAEKMKAEIENRLKDSRYTGNFAVNFEKGVKPDFFAKNVALFIERDLYSEGEAFLGISVLHPTMARDSRTYLTNGKLKDLLEYIKNPEFNSELEKTVLKLSKDLENMR